MLARVERTRIRADESFTEAQRDIQLKRLDGVATILAHIAASEPSLFVLLDENAEVSDTTRLIQREMQLAAGLEPEPGCSYVRSSGVADAPPERKVVPAVGGRGAAGQPVPGS